MMTTTPTTTQIEEGKKSKEMDIFETLLSPINLAGRFSLSHRVVLAPLTRCRALENIPHAAHVEYYSQRATPGGLLITEAVAVAQQGIGFPHSPGIFNEEQIEGWKRVVDVVHRKGAIIFCQLWHVGRASHTYYQPKGGPPVSSTSQGITQRWKIKLPREEGEEEEEFYSTPRSLTREEIHNVVQQFRRAAKNAMEAGFDGVEIHGGHGYLIDQFFKDNINDRNDEYGGSISNRCRFGLEVVSAVVEEVGCDRTAIRISPEIDHLDAHDSDPLALGLHLISRLNHFHLAYLHLTEPRFTAQGVNAKTSHYRLWPYRHAFEGIIIMSGGYNRESGMEAIQCGYADLVSYGRLFISNPDLPVRFALQAHLNPYDRSTFYTHHPVKGYTDYPFIINFLALHKDINMGMQVNMAISKDIDDDIDTTKPPVCRQSSLPQSPKSSLPLTLPTLTRSSSRVVF